MISEWGHYRQHSISFIRLSPTKTRTHTLTHTHTHTCTHPLAHTLTCTPTHPQASTHSPTRMNKQVITNGQVHIDRIASAAFNLHKLSSNWSPEDQETKIVFFGDGLAKDSCRLICSTRKPLLLAFASNVLFHILSHSMFPFSFLSLFLFFFDKFFYSTCHSLPAYLFLSLLISFSSSYLSLFSLSVALNVLSHSMGPFSFLHLSIYFQFSCLLRCSCFGR